MVADGRRPGSPASWCSARHQLRAVVDLPLPRNCAAQPPPGCSGGCRAASGSGDHSQQRHRGAGTAHPAVGLLTEHQKSRVQAASGLVVAAVFVLLVLPPLLAGSARSCSGPSSQPDSGERQGVWFRTADWVSTRAGMVAGASILLLGVLAASLIATPVGLSQIDQFGCAPTPSPVIRLWRNTFRAVKPIPPGGRAHRPGRRGGWAIPATSVCRRSFRMGQSATGPHRVAGGHRRITCFSEVVRYRCSPS